MRAAEMVSANALNDVVAERIRQVDEEGNSTAQDDAYKDNELLRAASCYLAPHALGVRPSDRPNNWPWSYMHWKPKNRRRDLVRAAALIVAEIERMDRANEA